VGRKTEPASLRARIQCDFARLRESKRDQWRARIERGGAAEALRISEELRNWMSARDPSWPTQQERDEDFETHVRVAEALARTAPLVRASSKKPVRGG